MTGVLCRSCGQTDAKGAEAANKQAPCQHCRAPLKMIGFNSPLIVRGARYRRAVKPMA
jgi:hypothetical protein